MHPFPACSLFRSITIDGLPIGGSPIQIKLISKIPELNKTVLQGDGLHTGIVGKPSKVNIRFMDAFGNPCHPGRKFKIAIAQMNELKKRLADVRPSQYEGRWLDNDFGTFEVSYQQSSSLR